MSLLKKRRVLTHGEKFVLVRNNIDFSDDTKNIIKRLTNLPARMNRQDALKYYTRKLRKYFGTDEPKQRELQKVEWYYDYYEAQRILDEFYTLKIIANKHKAH
jgi:hypothetical protein